MICQGLSKKAGILAILEWVLVLNGKGWETGLQIVLLWAIPWLPEKVYANESAVYAATLYNLLPVVLSNLNPMMSDKYLGINRPTFLVVRP